MAEKKKEIGGRNLPVGAKIVIVIFAVMFALSLMLPSLASFLNSSSQRQEENTEEVENTEATEETGEESEGESKDESTDEAATDGEAEPAEGETEATKESKDEDAAADEGKADEEKASDEEKADEKDKVDTSDVPDNDTLKSYAEVYKPRAQRYEDRLKEDPDNLAAILNLGRTYMNWGYQADSAAVDMPEHEYADKLIDEAIKNFEHYLELNESKSVSVDLALCKYYKDDLEGATADIKKLTETYPDYALAWANLGMLYEGDAEDEKATEAYRKASELDPDNTAGAKAFAEERIIAINATVSNLADASNASASNLETSAPSNSGLTDTLNNDTGLGL